MKAPKDVVYKQFSSVLEWPNLPKAFRTKVVHARGLTYTPEELAKQVPLWEQQAKALSQKAQERQNARRR